MHREVALPEHRGADGVWWTAVLAWVLAAATPISLLAAAFTDGGGAASLMELLAVPRR